MERRSMSRGDDRDSDRGRGRDNDRDSDRGRDRDRGSRDDGRGRGDDRDGDRSRNSRDHDHDSGRDRGRDERGSSRESRGRDDDRGSRDRGRGRDDDGGGRGSGSGSAYRYERRDDQATKDRASKGAKDFDVYLSDKVKLYKVHDNANDIRILPPTWKKAEHFGYDIHMHFGVGPDRQSYLCPNKMNGDPCPICEERALALKDGDEEYAKELEPKRRVLYYLVDRKHMKEGLQAWAAPWTVDRDLVKVMVDKKTGEALPIDDPENGYDVEFDKTGSKDRTKYEAVAIARRESSLDAPAALDFAVDNPLPEMLVFYDYDHIAKVFGGGSAGGGSSRSSRDDDRGRDRDSDRGRSSSRDDDRGSSRSSSRDDDRGSRRSSRDEDEPTWDGLHGMTFEELEAVIDSKSLKINPDRAKDEAELADWICEDLDIKQAKKRESEDGAGRLAEMRRSRGD